MKHEPQQFGLTAATKQACPLRNQKAQASTWLLLVAPADFPVFLFPTA